MMRWSVGPKSSVSLHLLWRTFWSGALTARMLRTLLTIAAAWFSLGAKTAILRHSQFMSIAYANWETHSDFPHRREVTTLIACTISFLRQPYLSMTRFSWNPRPKMMRAHALMKFSCSTAWPALL